MYAKFLKLGIPISSHFPFSCTEFRFSLVGELRSVRNDPTAARMIIPKTLITACKPDVPRLCRPFSRADFSH